MAEAASVSAAVAAARRESSVAAAASYAPSYTTTTTSSIPTTAAATPLSSSSSSRSSDVVAKLLQRQSAVAADLMRAVQQSSSSTSEYCDDDNNSNNSNYSSNNFTDLCDVSLLAAGGAAVPACRFVLAARSAVFRRMLYGAFREAKSSSICMLGYPACILRAVVHFCNTNELLLLLLTPHPLLLPFDDADANDERDAGHGSCTSNTINSGSTATAASRNANSSNSNYIRLLVQLAQAADYLQLPVLQELVERQHVLRHMVRAPDTAVCTVLQEAVLGSHLANAALHMIECRPYATLRGCNSGSGSRSSSRNNSAGRGASAAAAASGLGGGGGGGGGVTCLSAEKLEQVLRNPYTGASEWFLFQQLSRWYDYQLEQLVQHQHHPHSTADTDTDTASADDSSVHDDGRPSTSSSDARSSAEALLFVTTRELCQRYIRLSHIEPAHLLSPAVRESCPWVTQQAVFEAVARQALRASREKVWRLHHRGQQQQQQQQQQTTNSTSPTKHGKVNGGNSGSSCVDRVLVEGAGSRDVDGMYYRIAAGCLSNGSDLYSKREVAVGQQYVYTMSRCLRTRSAIRAVVPDKGNEDEDDDDGVGGGATAAYYECRIFCSKFLTHRAVRNLQRMQSTATIVPCFQPVLQVLELTPPANYDSAALLSSENLSHGRRHNHDAFAAMIQAAVPTPIRKYYRVRLSDGDQHMPGTLSPELNALIENGELKENHVLQVLEFGVYTIYGCAGIHVMKAVVVTTSPSYVFGDPIPLEDAAVGSTNRANNDNDAQDDDDDDEGGNHGLRHLYTSKCSVVDEHCRIPKTGWQVDDHGAAPAPECTWIPSTTTSASSRVQTSSGSSSPGLSVRSSSISISSGLSSSPRRSTSPRSVATVTTCAPVD